jgi:hypothetical protein
MKTMTRSIVRITSFFTAVVVFATIGAGLSFYLSHRKVVVVSTQTALAKFAQLRAQFPDQPLVDMSLRRASEKPVASPASAPLHSFHTVIFDTRGEQRIVSITVPFWFARRCANRNGEFNWLGELTFLDDTEFDPEPINLSLDQIERRGPGLVAYLKHPSGGQFLSWVD